MKSRYLVLIVIAVFILILGGCGCNGYNNMVNLDENVKAKWGNVQSDYQRRSDLIPNLVNTVKGAANFEQETLTKVIEARAKATSVNVNAGDLTPENMAKFQQAERCIKPSVGNRRKVSGTQSHAELPGLAKTIGGNRKPY